MISPIVFHIIQIIQTSPFLHRGHFSPTASPPSPPPFVVPHPHPGWRQPTPPEAPQRWEDDERLYCLVGSTILKNMNMIL